LRRRKAEGFSAAANYGLCRVPLSHIIKVDCVIVMKTAMGSMTDSVIMITTGFPIARIRIGSELRMEPDTRTASAGGMRPAGTGCVARDRG